MEISEIGRLIEDNQEKNLVVLIISCCFFVVENSIPE
jgi:hypothetical protein